VAIPAMMIGHLTIAGFAEFFVSAGVVAFLQKSDPSLLGEAGPRPAMFSSARPLWATLGVLMILTPLGILAAGSAWGEWSAADYSKPAVRRQIAAATFHQAPPPQPPAGLARLSSLWTAPFASYAPPYIRSAAFGYLLSAMFGAGLVTLACAGVSKFAR
jgi:cobalt/nickel transport system permease protein